jgi:hypothetical protein
VKISSNSWWGEAEDYDYQCYSADRFIWRHDDMLALFAAGNEGDEGYFQPVMNDA